MSVKCRCIELEMNYQISDVSTLLEAKADKDGNDSDRSEEKRENNTM